MPLKYRISKFPIFAAHLVVVAQLVRASDCGSEGRGFDPRHPPANPAPEAGFVILYPVPFAVQHVNYG